MIEETVIGLLSFIFLVAVGVFLLTFVFHVIFTPHEDKIREIIREELSLFKEDSDESRS